MVHKWTMIVVTEIVKFHVGETNGMRMMVVSQNLG
ncbi:hypothetical protein A2U01_0082794, partial [Trifolium medium]|nr:hypothetical protein [Trifolium medium]